MPTNVHQWNVQLPTPGNDVAPAAPPGTTSGSNFRAFLGYGLLRPFRRDRKTDFAAAGGEALVRSCVGQILGTLCSDPTGLHQGELPWRPEFGSLLYFLRFKKGPMLQELGRVYVAQALARWEPRVQLSASQISFDDSTRILTISVRYNVIDKNVPGNAVILRDVEQTVSLPLAA